MMPFIQSFFQSIVSTQLPTIEHDEEWTSPCIDKINETTQAATWSPKKKQGIDFSGLENAFEIEIHKDLYQFYGQYWSDHLTVSYQNDAYTLLFLWNKQDETQLLHNLVGHIEQKRRLKLPLSLFIGIATDDSVITIKNETGEILKESWPKKEGAVIAPSLEVFLSNANVTYSTNR